MGGARVRGVASRAGVGKGGHMGADSEGARQSEKGTTETKNGEAGNESRRRGPGRLGANQDGALGRNGRTPAI